MITSSAAELPGKPRHNDALRQVRDNIGSPVGG